MFTTSDLQRIAVSLLAAAALATVCVAGAVAPAGASAAPRGTAFHAVSAPVVTGLVGAVRY